MTHPSAQVPGARSGADGGEGAVVSTGVVAAAAGQRVRRRRTRLRDALLSVLFLAAGLYVALLGGLGFAGSTRGALAAVGEQRPYFWYAVVVGGAALLAGGCLVLWRGHVGTVAWWLTLAAAIPGLLLWLVVLVSGLSSGGGSTGADIGGVGVVVAYLVLGQIGRAHV